MKQYHDEMPANNVALQASNLLKHYEEYGVVICRTCQFAVQPSALASHLLKHQIYRGERRKLLSYLCKLRLREPSDVVDPPPGSPPVPELPVSPGYSCLSPGCQHVCASAKRMAQHWSDVHGERESRNVQARDCWLQTFFRGNKIRYFEVSAPHDTPPQPTESSSTPTSTPATRSVDHREESIEDSNGNIASDLTPPLDMAALRYLHHFTTVTSLTLPRTAIESTYHWSITIVQEAFKFPFLMYGILGVAAFHLSKIPHQDPLEVKRHEEASIRYQNSSLADFRDLAQRPDASNAVALIAYARAIGIQRCCRIPDFSAGLDDLSQLVEFLHLIRGNTETLLSLQHLLPEGSDFKLPIEEIEYLNRQDDMTISFTSPPGGAFNNVPPELMERIRTLPLRLYQAVAKCQGDSAELETPNAKAAISACVSLVSAFERVYAVPQVENPSGQFVGSSDSDTIAMVWTGLEHWVRFIPDLFIRMLEEGNQTALIIFAHFCFLLKKFEDRYWFCYGLPDRLLLWIEANVDDELKGFVADLV